MVFWGGLFASPTQYRVWENEPGGTVVDEYNRNGTDYVVVIFERTPDRKYIYLKA